MRTFDLLMGDVLPVEETVGFSLKSYKNLFALEKNSTLPFSTLSLLRTPKTLALLPPFLLAYRGPLENAFKRFSSFPLPVLLQRAHFIEPKTPRYHI